MLERALNDMLWIRSAIRDGEFAHSLNYDHEFSLLAPSIFSDLRGTVLYLDKLGCIVVDLFMELP